MGRYKRSKSKPRFRPQEIRVDELPERFRKVVPIVNTVLFKFFKEKKIANYQIFGPRLNGTVFLIGLKFPFWKESVSRINLFISKRDDECSVTQTKYGSDFDVLIGTSATESTVYEAFNYQFEIMHGGLLLETEVVETLNDFYTRSGQPYRVRNASFEEDKQRKLDIIVSGFEQGIFGVQLKKKREDWINHRNKHPHVPSILLGPQTPARKLVGAIQRIAFSLQNKRVEHIDLYNHEKPPT